MKYLPKPTAMKYAKASIHGITVLSTSKATKTKGISHMSKVVMSSGATYTRHIPDVVLSQLKMNGVNCV